MDFHNITISFGFKKTLTLLAEASRIPNVCRVNDPSCAECADWLLQKRGSVLAIPTSKVQRKKLRREQMERRGGTAISKTAPPHPFRDYSPEAVLAPKTYSVPLPRISRALAWLLSPEVGISSVLAAGARRSTTDAFTVRTSTSS